MISALSAIFVGQNGMQFWLGACFKTDIEFASMAHKFFNHRTHLIDLYRIDQEALTW